MFVAFDNKMLSTESAHEYSLASTTSGAVASPSEQLAVRPPVTPLFLVVSHVPVIPQPELEPVELDELKDVVDLGVNKLDKKLHKKMLKISRLWSFLAIIQV